MSEAPIRYFIYVNDQEKQRKQRNKQKQKTESEKHKGREGSSTPATLQEDFAAGWRRLTDSTNRGADLRYEEHPTTQGRVGVRVEFGRRSHRDWTMSPPPTKAKETGEVDVQNQAPEHSIGIRLGHGRLSDRIHEALAKRLKHGGSMTPAFNPEPTHAAGMDLCTPQTTPGPRGTPSSLRLVIISPGFRTKEKRGRSHTWLAHGGGELLCPYTRTVTPQNMEDDQGV
ncbi:hypothetical protein VNO77_34585 [Canavalia gladiata]|uniref:Uncharacterized protein n=1 Tax=Canavalia gladiata TaxID=3824 RepID=A0AAN9PYN1_CANGL